jgi:cytochrome c-type biogenesis protein CcmF
MDEGSAISWLGRGLVMSGLLFAVIGAVLGITAGMRKSVAGWAQARVCAYGFSGSMIAANLLMIYALVTHDFSVAYVAEVGSRATPTYYTVISLWASLNGSILFWGGILGVYVLGVTWAYRDTHREYMPYTLGVLLGVSVFFAFLVASIANPFAPVSPVPMDGPGPNPLLQNHWLMAWHPPALYLGYVGMAVPFAMTAAALLTGRLDAGWMAPLRRWTLIPWAFLTIGITMGGWWSYEVLGWGGYWAWDPVENASFMPWLTGTAFLHSAMVLQRKGTLRTWTLVLGLSTFLLTLLGTFMTRSGVFNSVHSFTQSDIGPVFLAFIAVVLVFSVLLLAFRDHVLEEATGRPSEGAPSDPISRETAIMLQNVAFAVFTFTVLLGVLYPLIAEGLFERKVSVGEPYFDRMALPLGLAIVFLMGVGPAVPWGRMRPNVALRRFMPPLVAGLVTAGIAFPMGIQKPYVLLALALCAFALVANLGELLEPVLARIQSKGENPIAALAQVFGRSRRRFGGHVAHYGVVMAVAAIAMSSGYKVEKDFVLRTGETATLGEWSATYHGAQMVKEAHRDSMVASFSLTKGGEDMGLREPRLNYYKRMMEPIGTPAVRSTLGGDFYMSLMQVDPEAGRVSVRIMTMPLVPWLWVSAGVIFAGCVMVLWPQRQQREAVAAAVAAREATASK